MTELDDAPSSHVCAGIPDLGRLASSAREAAEYEHRIIFSRGVWLYPEPMAWSALLSATIVMEGYDTTFIGNFFAYPVFRKSYGRYVPGNGYHISPS
jgi:SP family general alpha glucoside:H+ symporter-like MFS transporter